MRILLPRHTLILIMGNAGTGKSTLAKELLKLIACVYLDNNFVADAFYQDTRTDPEYVKLRPRLYDVLYRITKENLDVQNTVLLDVPHVTHMQDVAWRQRLEKMVRDADASLAIVRCRCSPAVLHARLSTRAEERDVWKLAHWGEFLAREPLDLTIPLPHLTVNTEDDLELNVERSVAYIEGLWV